MVEEAVTSYRVAYERDESGWWVATVRGVRGCHTQGRTVDEARRRIREALELFVDDARKALIVDDVKLPTTATRAIRAYARLRKKADEEDRRAARAARRAARRDRSAVAWSDRESPQLASPLRCASRRWRRRDPSRSARCWGAGSGSAPRSMVSSVLACAPRPAPRRTPADLGPAPGVPSQTRRRLSRSTTAWPATGTGCVRDGRDWTSPGRATSPAPRRLRLRRRRAHVAPRFAARLSWGTEPRRPRLSVGYARARHRRRRASAATESL